MLVAELISHSIFLFLILNIQNPSNFVFLGKPVVPPPTSAPVVSKPAIIVAPGATSRLIHPDEDISLVRTCLYFIHTEIF